MQSFEGKEDLFPRVSFIIPTLNVEVLLDNCLSSIARQTYPCDRYEILLADAHSKDSTREIAKRYSAVVIDDDGANMEEGKRLALSRATGEYVVFVDADNEISHPDYIELAVKALAANSQALGVESYYPPSPKMSSFCAYLTHLLHISDPICWLMSRNPKLVASASEVERWTIPGDSLSYPLGANGFVFRRADLESVRAKENFQDTHVAMHLMRSGKREWLRIRGRGVHHYYVQTLWGFVKKRRRATVHTVRMLEAMSVNWMREKPPVPLWLAALYCVTFIGPLWHTVLGLIRDRDPRWLWHIPASPASVIGDAWGVLTAKMRKGDRKLVATLQVKQTLKYGSNRNVPSNDAVARATPKVHFIVNGIFSTTIAGGDIHFLKLAEAVTRGGYELNLFGGTALKEVAEKHKLDCTVTLTDDTAMGRVKGDALGGQLAMFRDFFRRYRRTLHLFDRIGSDDFVYATSDYWFDVLPVVRCRSRKKLMVLHMEAPRLKQIVGRSRADVDALRLASLHYWASQEWSLRRFCSYPPSRGRKHLFHLHPLMKPRLQKLGLPENEMTLVSYGLDLAAVDAVPPQARVYDVVWIGRVHRQKGISDLLETLRFLAQKLPDLRAVFIGNLRDALLPQVKEMGLEKHVEFSGFVSEEEKTRLFKASRVFLMPSKHEGSPRVIGESIIAGTPVVAYDIPNYRLLFDDFVQYTPAFDLAAFRQAALSEIQQMRSGANYLDRLDIARFKQENSWETLQGKFLSVLQRMK